MSLSSMRSSRSWKTTTCWVMTLGSANTICQIYLTFSRTYSDTVSEQKDRWRFSIHTYIIHMPGVVHIDLLKLARRTPLLHTSHEQKRISANSPKFIANLRRLSGYSWIFRDFREGVIGLKIGERSVK